MEALLISKSFSNGGHVRLPGLTTKLFHAFFIFLAILQIQSSFQGTYLIIGAFADGGVPDSRIAPAASPSIKRSDFPADFKFGASTSALQTEGPANIGGRGPTTWDFLLTLGPEFIGQPTSANVATLSYLRYKEDVKLLKYMGVDLYRFSISWSRILPNGTGQVNQEGIDFYNNLINELIANDIEPFVTLFHFDLPTALQNKYNGFLGSQIVEDFKNYSDICFKHFGDRVKYWLTVNEPQILAQYGYVQGLNISDDPARYPYIVAHNIILAHAAVTRNYRENYQATQGGQIGMSLLVQWFEALANTKEDKDAAIRAFAFQTGWFTEPLVFGEYPSIMRKLVGNRLPTFTAEEKEMVKGAYDFIGINYYTSLYVRALPINTNAVPVNFTQDQFLVTEGARNGVPIGDPIEANGIVYIMPDGLRDAMIYMKKNYKDPIIYITENGVTELRNDTLPLKQALMDDVRVIFIRRHLNAIEEALRKDVKVKGYMHWSLLDSMEPGSGYSLRMGLGYTDYNDNLKRYPKKSAQWYKKFLKKG